MTRQQVYKILSESHFWLEMWRYTLLKSIQTREFVSLYIFKDCSDNFGSIDFYSYLGGILSIRISFILRGQGATSHKNLGTLRSQIPHKRVCSTCRDLELNRIRQALRGHTQLKSKNKRKIQKFCLTKRIKILTILFYICLEYLLKKLPYNF